MRRCLEKVTAFDHKKKSATRATPHSSFGLAGLAYVASNDSSGLYATVPTQRIVEYLPVDNFWLLPSVSSCFSFSSTALACSLCSKVWICRCLGKSRLLITSEIPRHVATPHSSCCLPGLASVGRMLFRPLRHRLYSTLARILAGRNSNCCLASALASPSPALPWPARSVPRSGFAVAWASHGY